MSETGKSEVTAGTPSHDRLGSDIDDALKFDPSWSIACVPSPPFDRASIARHWKAMKEEIKRLRLEVERLQDEKVEAPMSEANDGCRQRIVGPDVPPTDDVGRWERGKSPWHADAFPDVFKARAPEQGDRKEGWFKIDWCGNAIGWVPDGTVIRQNERPPARVSSANDGSVR